MVETLGPIFPLTAESQIGKMRDVYPISIFRFKIILALITAGKFTEAVLLLQITLLLNSVRFNLFSRRKDLLHQCFSLIPSVKNCIFISEENDFELMDLRKVDKDLFEVAAVDLISPYSPS
jgi:hypothetical protein